MHTPAHTPAPARRKPLSYWLSMALLALLGLSVLGFFWLGGFFARQRGPAPAPPAPAAGADAPSAATAPRKLVIRAIEMRGMDKKGQPFTLRAARSERGQDNKDIMRFHDVRAELHRHGAPAQTARADLAIQDKAKKEILLRGNVVIRTPGAWTLHAKSLKIDTNTRDMQSTEPVRVRLNNGGRIDAAGMASREGRKVIVFSGPVKARFFVMPEEAGASDEQQ